MEIEVVCGTLVFAPLDGKRYIKTAIGKADDYAHADDKDTFSFSQAQEKARQFAIKICRGIDVEDNQPYTVQRAVEDYLHDFKASGKKIAGTDSITDQSPYPACFCRLSYF